MIPSKPADQRCSESVTCKLSQPQLRLVEAAAALRGEFRSAFMRAATVEAAERTLAERAQGGE